MLDPLHSLPPRSSAQKLPAWRQETFLVWLSGLCQLQQVGGGSLLALVLHGK